MLAYNDHIWQEYEVEHENMETHENMESDILPKQLIAVIISFCDTNIVQPINKRLSKECAKPLTHDMTDLV